MSRSAQVLQAVRSPRSLNQRGKSPGLHLEPLECRALPSVAGLLMQPVLGVTNAVDSLAHASLSTTADLTSTMDNLASTPASSLANAPSSIGVETLPGAATLTSSTIDHVFATTVGSVENTVLKTAATHDLGTTLPPVSLPNLPISIRMQPFAPPAASGQQVLQAIPLPQTGRADLGATPPQPAAGATPIIRSILRTGFLQGVTPTVAVQPPVNGGGTEMALAMNQDAPAERVANSNLRAEVGGMDGAVVSANVPPIGSTTPSVPRLPIQQAGAQTHLGTSQPPVAQARNLSLLQLVIAGAIGAGVVLNAYRDTVIRRLGSVVRRLRPLEPTISQRNG